MHAKQIKLDGDTADKVRFHNGLIGAHASWHFTIRYVNDPVQYPKAEDSGRSLRRLPLVLAINGILFIRTFRRDFFRDICMRPMVMSTAATRDSSASVVSCFVMMQPLTLRSTTSLGERKIASAGLSGRKRERVTAYIARRTTLPVITDA